jgi:hypothetical protein
MLGNCSNSECHPPCLPFFFFERKKFTSLLKEIIYFTSGENFRVPQIFLMFVLP